MGLRLYQVLKRGETKNGNQLVLRRHLLQKNIEFVPDLDLPVIPGPYQAPAGPPVRLMSGKSILAHAARQHGLRYQLNDGAGYPRTDPNANPPYVNPTQGHIEFLSYTPVEGDVVSLPHKPTAPQAFPFVGLPLTLVQSLNPIGDISFIFQYTVDKPTSNDVVAASAQFGENGFEDGSNIRVRLLSIYRSSLVLGR